MINNNKTKKSLRILFTVIVTIVLISSLVTVAFAEETSAVTDSVGSEEKDGFQLKDILLIPMGFIIRVCYNISNNYAVALLLFALVMQVILFPLGIKQQKNTNKQASLRPKESAIRKKYAGRNDQATQQKLQQEIMALYQQENFNPASGCLPLLIQLPIIFALFAVVRQPLTYITRLSSGKIAILKEQITAILKNAGTTITSGYEEIEIISYLKEHGVAGITGVTEAEVAAMPDFTMFGGMFDISVRPSTNIWSIYILVPILTFVVMYLSQIITKKFTYRPEPAGGDANTQNSMKIMEWMMPLMSVYFAFIVPSAIGVYWIFRNILSVIQQFILSKMYPTPRFTEEELKAAEKEYLGKTKKTVKTERDPNRPRPRSLHTIDFDDDEETDTGTSASVKKAPEKTAEANPALGAAPLKEDKPPRK